MIQQIKLPERYKPVFAIAGLLLICLLFFHQLLFSGEVVNATDILTQQYFWNVFTKESLLTDPCFRTWLPYVNAGTPFSGGLDLIFRPVSLLTLLLLPVHIAINYEMVLYLFLMGVGMYLYMREIKVSHLGAFLAALFLMLNGEIVSLINAGHVNKIGAIFPVSFVFWTLERALRRKTLRAFLLTGFVLGFQFWQGHVQISYYTCIAVGIYYLIRIGFLYREHYNLKQISTLTGFAVIMVIVFLLLSAVEFLPLISFAQVSERAEGVSYEFATSWSMPPEELATYLVPGFFGLRRLNHDEDEDIIPYWGRMPFTQTGRYFGLLPLLCVFLALCFVRKKHVLTLSVIAVIVLLLGMGKYIPTYKLLYEYAPGFNKFRVPQMILFLFAFATSGLAGFGAEWLLSNMTDAKEKRLRIFVLCGMLLFLVALLISTHLPQVNHDFIGQFREALLRKGGTPDIAAARFGNIINGLLQFSVLFGIALFVIGLRLAPKIRLGWVIAAILMMYLIDIGMFNEKYLDTIPLEGSMYVRENDAIRYLKGHPGLYRVLPATDTPESYSTFNKYLYYHLFSISGYEAVGVQYYTEYLRHMALGTPLVDLLNVKYIILPKDAQINGENVELEKRFGPYKVVMDSDAILLENSNVLPRVFPVHNARQLTDKEQIFATLLNQSFNPLKTVIIEEELPAGFQEEQGKNNDEHSPQSVAEITHHLHRTIRLKAKMVDDGFLVLSEKYYPGWKAYVNGQQTKIYKADYTLQAIYLPKGEYDVTFAFQPRQFIAGLGITVITCLGLLGAALYFRRTRISANR